MSQPPIFLISDSQQSVINSTGIQSDASCYTAFGFQFFSSKLLINFNGQHSERATGCYLLGNGFRAYSPALGRFLSPDSLSPFGGGGINIYAYCTGDPINFTDPSGHALLPSLAMKIKTPSYKQLTKLLATAFPEHITYKSTRGDVVKFVMRRNDEITKAYVDQLSRVAPRSKALLAGKPPLHARTVINNMSTQNNGFVRSLMGAPKDQAWTHTFSGELLKNGPAGLGNSLAPAFISDVLGTPGQLSSRRVLKSLQHITQSPAQVKAVGTRTGAELPSSSNAALRKS